MVLVTRPLADTQRTCDALEAAGIAALSSPLMSIEIDTEVSAPQFTPSALVFTSANGVRAHAAQSWFAPQPAFCVGEASAEAARSAGHEVIGVGTSDMAVLADLIAEASPQGCLLHPRGVDAAGDLVAALAERGVTAKGCVMYKAAAVTELSATAISAIRAQPLGIALFSPRTAQLFERLIIAHGLTTDLAKCTALCLSPAVADIARRLPFRHVVAASYPNEAAFVDMATSLRT